jgi:hypothetical protein
MFDMATPKKYVDAWSIAEEVCKKQLIAVHGSLEEGMKYHGIKEFNKMVDAVEAALEEFCNGECQK